MGVAKITNIDNADIGKYSIELVKDPGLSAKRLAAIAKRLAEIAPLMLAAETAYATALNALSTAYEALDAAITQQKSSEAEQTAVVAAIQEVGKKKQTLDRLKSEKLLLEREQAVLTTAMQAETRNNVWCIDKTTDLTVNQVIGTAEINGEAGTILIYPGGAAEDLGGILQPTGVSTPSAVFFNWAILPGWQKWKPTYRTGTIVDIDYDEGTCDVALDLAYSSTGLPINQAGEEYLLLQPAVTGWTQFCDDNPGFPLVSNTASASIEMTAQLKADLLAVNAEVNSRYNYKLDTETYGKLEHWTTMSPGGSGDCEDFALTKAKELLALGYPASAIHIEIGLTPKGVGHAWLVVQTDKGDIALDIGYGSPMPNGALPYTNRRRQTGREWGEATVILRATPIYYMGDEDAALFLPPQGEVSGDGVVIEFVEQDWTQPIIIGFESNPRATSVNFFIGKSTSPFSEYARQPIQERCWRYFSTGPNATLSNLANERIQLLVLPCPIRVLTDEEKTAIAAFRARGGRIALFAGNDRSHANQILEQLGSRFEIMPKPVDTNIYIKTGYMLQGTPATVQMFWIAGRISGWVGIRKVYWPEATLNDFLGYGLRYNTKVTAMMYGAYRRQTDPSDTYQSIHDAILKAYLEGSPTPEYEWASDEGFWPEGYLGTYPADAASWIAWLTANASKLPYLHFGPYGWTMPLITFAYGQTWDIDKKGDADLFMPLIAYSDDGILAAAMKLEMLTSETGNSDMLDYYFHSDEFFEWLISGSRPIHDYYQQSSTLETFNPYHAYFTGPGSGAPIGFMPGQSTG